MRRILTGAAVSFAVSLLILGVASAETIEDTLERTMPFSSGSRLEVSNTNGDIEILTWDRDEIHIRARKKVKSSDTERARKAFKELEIKIDETGTGVTIDTDHPRRGPSWWGRDISMSVHYVISVPVQADLDLGTVNGKVRVEGVNGELDLRTTNGGIVVEDAGGHVSARTTNGGIDVELNEVSSGEDMTFSTTNGGITLLLPTDIKATLTARTTNGGIHTDFPITIQGSVGRNRLEGDLNGGGGTIALRTTNGGIRIREL